jgi:hypothetical protein
MAQQSGADHPSAGSWVLVVIAWILVGVPLLWGVYVTLKKASLLFR